MESDPVPEKMLFSSFRIPHDGQNNNKTVILADMNGWWLILRRRQ
jgi:hypothetical protein